MNGQLQAPGALSPGERAPSTHSIGGWVGFRTGLDDVEKRKFLTLPGLKLRPLGRPAIASRYTECISNCWYTGVKKNEVHTKFGLENL
jgi:hypothetical protein